MTPKNGDNNGSIMHRRSQSEQLEPVRGSWSTFDSVCARGSPNHDAHRPRTRPHPGLPSPGACGRAAENPRAPLRARPLAVACSSNWMYDSHKARRLISLTARTFLLFTVALAARQTQALSPATQRGVRCTRWSNRVLQLRPRQPA